MRWPLRGAGALAPDAAVAGARGRVIVTAAWPCESDARNSGHSTRRRRRRRRVSAEEELQHRRRRRCWRAAPCTTSSASRRASTRDDLPSSPTALWLDPSSGAPGPQRRLLLAAKRLKSCGHSARAAKIPQNQLLSCETPAKISRRGRAFSRNRQALSRIRTEGLGRPI